MLAMATRTLPSEARSARRASNWVNPIAITESKFIETERYEISHKLHVFVSSSSHNSFYENCAPRRNMQKFFWNHMFLTLCHGILANLQRIQFDLSLKQKFVRNPITCTEQNSHVWLLSKNYKSGEGLPCSAIQQPSVDDPGGSSQFPAASVTS